MIARFFLEPFHDLLEALNRALPQRAWVGLVAAVAGIAASWWFYVPAHELLHAFGCLATGGSVHQLEIRAEYGAALLQRVFPFVTVGSEYAGRLSGFDTHGSDLTYLATVFAPYLLTVLIGVPLIKFVLTRSAGVASCALLGAALPVAFAPFTNVLGDYYELGSIFSSRVARELFGTSAADAWRSDDLLLLLGEAGADFGPADYSGIVAGLVLAAIGALATYRLGAAFAGLFVGPALVRQDPAL